MTPAQTKATELVETLNTVLFFPAIYLLMSVAFLVFVWGLVEYVFNAASDQGREKGKKNMLFGLIGLAIMVSAWGILSLAAGTFGLSDELDCAQDPSASGCSTIFTIPDP